MKPRFLLGVALCSLVWLTGCGGAGGKLNPVSGKVTGPDGKLLSSGTVMFHANDKKGNTSGIMAVGEINSQGEYSLITSGKPGAPAGAYKVTVTVNDNVTPDNTKPSTKKTLNVKYATTENTPLEKDVVENAAPGAYDLKVDP